MFGFEHSGILIAVVAIAFFVLTGFKIVKEYERAVVFRLGRLVEHIKGPGIIYIIPIIDSWQKVSLQMITLDIPPQDVITRDNVSVKVNAVMNFQVMDPNKAINKAENYLYTTSQMAQTTLRSILGEVELDELLSHRDKINAKLQAIIDEKTDPFGVKVIEVEVKHVDLPKEMQRAMAKQAEAERERRAKIIAAEGELQASQKLTEAAGVMAKEPITIQLRYLQTLAEIATENNSTTVFPVPIDIFKNFFTKEK